MAALFQDADDMKAETPLMEENPTPKNNVTRLILGAPGKLDQRLNSLETRQLETRQAQPEKHYIGSENESWQNLSSGGGAEK